MTDSERRRLAGSDWLPPGQTETRKFPVVGESEPAAEAVGWSGDLRAWRLRLEGRVERPEVLTWSEFQELPTSELVADIHCVTGWSHRQMRFGGVPLTRLLERAQPRPEARFVRFEAYSERRHDTTLPLELAAETWLVSTGNGEPLAVEHGYPLRTVTPSRYFYKSLKWLHRIELLAEDQLGYWEREWSYHNTGDPWAGDQRFTTGSVNPERLERFRNAASFAAFRGSRKGLLGVDLEGWRPRGLDLRELFIKNSNLSGARFGGADLRGANLSLSDLTGADLRDANLRGADLEGANFAGADLRGADLRDTLLSATRFFTVDTEGQRIEARVAGLEFDGATGLLEEQERFLQGAAPEDAPRSNPEG